MSQSRKIIVVVDDNPVILKSARNVLMKEYDVFTVPSGEKLFQLLDRLPTPPDLILLDVMMPAQSGYDVIKTLKLTPSTSDIPVMFLTAKSDTDSEVEGLSLGAVDYLGKPFSAPILAKRVALHLQLKHQKQALKSMNDHLAALVQIKTSEILRLQEAVLKMVARVVEYRDDVTGGHIMRTEKILSSFIDAMLASNTYEDTLNDWDGRLVVQSSLLHDIGKISVPDAILLKPAKLTTEEFTVIKTHTTVGEALVAQMCNDNPDSVFLEHARLMASTHHERWDGAGYPYGLSGTEIPLEGRIMAFADVYDALTSERPYKKAFSHEKAVRILREQNGKQFDPALTEIFIASLERPRNGEMKPGRPQWVCMTSALSEERPRNDEMKPGRAGQ
ncbi:MAG: response regulator [Desulfovibrio sp.]|nr:response regulator [Desulfovibrio sp.]